MHLLSRPPAEMRTIAPATFFEALQNTPDDIAIFLPFRAAEFRGNSCSLFKLSSLAPPANGAHALR
jgi:hypothetical protein